MIRWEIQRARCDRSTDIDTERLEYLLSEGWEPFAVVGDISTQTMFLRRKVVEPFALTAAELDGI